MPGTHWQSASIEPAQITHPKIKTRTMDIRGYEAQFHCFGSDGPKLHFAHANGLPFRTYKTFLEYLTPAIDVCGIDNRGAWGMHPDPVSSQTWDEHVNDLIAFLDGHYGEPVIGVGHSLGGTVSLLAASSRPDLFQSLVLIDAATSPHWFADWVMGIAPNFISSKVPLIKKTASRRRVWESREQFIEHHQSRRAFQHFTEEAMIDYADGGLRPTKDGEFELVFNPAWEAHNFRTTPCIWGQLAKISVPTLFLTAEHSYVYDLARLRRKSRQFPDTVEWRVLRGLHHLAPQQDPAAVASTIAEWLETQ